MKTKTILFLLISVLFLLTFFLKIIPIPVENIDGGKDPDHFIMGGYYWTSGLYQLTAGNYQATLLYLGIFGLLVLLVSLLTMKK